MDDTNAVVINNRLAEREPTLQVGRTFTLSIGGRETTWQVVGIARQAFAAPTVYANYDYFIQTADQAGKTRSVRIATEKHDDDFVNAVKRDLEGRLEGAGLRALSNSSRADSRKVYDDHLIVIYTFLMMMAFVIVAVGGLGLMTTMSINVLERRREMGVLRAIGATSKAVLLIILGEGALIGALSWILAVALAWLVSDSIGNFIVNQLFETDLDFRFDVLGAIVWLVIVIVFGALASFLPAWNASRVTVRQVVEYA
ncbi:MAG: FtsX-like permease family protein [Chloroflexi bacterium]|nr:FtsX-like permease family protein [Chloroflexota bacterium]